MGFVSADSASCTGEVENGSVARRGEKKIKIAPFQTPKRFFSLHLLVTACILGCIISKRGMVGRDFAVERRQDENEALSAFVGTVAALSVDETPYKSGQNEPS